MEIKRHYFALRFFMVKFHRRTEGYLRRLVDGLESAAEGLGVADKTLQDTFHSHGFLLIFVLLKDAVHNRKLWYGDGTQDVVLTWHTQLTLVRSFQWKGNYVKKACDILVHCCMDTNFKKFTVGCVFICFFIFACQRSSSCGRSRSCRHRRHRKSIPALRALVVAWSFDQLPQCGVGVAAGR